MRRGTALAAVFIALAASRLHARPFGVSYSGIFDQDNDRRIFYVTLSAPRVFSARTWSYAGGTTSQGQSVPAGGFDPTLSLYTTAGDLIAQNQDGACGDVGADPVTSLCWDANLLVSLPAGNYILVLTQSDNTANGPTLADGFVYDGDTAAQTRFTPAPAGLTPLFWDDSEHQRTGAWTVEVFGASTSEVTTITSSATLPPGVVGSTYGPFTFAAQSGASATLAWSVVSGSLPAGLVLDSATGVLSGAPTTSGHYTFTVQVTDGLQPATQAVSLTISTPLAITTSALPPGAVGQPYGPVPLNAFGGSGSWIWNVSGLPAGLTLDSTNAISGTPTAGGSSQVQISVYGSGSSAASVTLPLVVNFAPLHITSSGALGEFVTASNVAGKFAASGGKPPYTWSAPNLPPGFNLNPATGDFSGSAALPGAWSFTATVRDAETPAVTSSLNVAFKVFGFSTASVPPGTAGIAYSQNLSATGGTPPYVFSSTGLPAGFSLSASGVLTGTPKAAGNFAFSVQVADAAGMASASLFNLVISGATSPLSAPGGALVSGNVGVPYSAALQVSGGSAPYTWSIPGGGLPDGLSLSSSGTIQGTPKKAGTWSFGALATDAASATAVATFTIAIAPAQLTLTSLSSLPVGVVGSEYPLQIFTASGGAAPYVFSISGNLPDGLTFLSPQLTGVPTAAGLANFTVKATDANGQTASGPASILIQPAHADLILSQTSVPFFISVGSSGVPTPASVTVRSSVIAQRLSYSLTVSPAAPWLQVTGGGLTPGAIGITLDPSALSLSAANSPFQTTIIVNCVAPSPCAGASQQIAVSLDVSAPPAQLTFDTNLLSFVANASAPGRRPQSLNVQNPGGGALTIHSITGTDAWLSLSGVPSTVQSGPAVPVTVTADSTALSPGYYNSSLVFDTSAGLQTLPVSLLVSPGLMMNLAPQGTQIEMPAGNAPGSSAGSFRISAAASSPANWSASVLPGASWLAVSPATGAASNSSPGIVNFTIDPAAAAALAPGHITARSESLRAMPLIHRSISAWS